MDKEKLEKTAEDYFNGKYKSVFQTRVDVENAFKSGAEWMMGLPLSERLTEEEREKIKAIFKKAKDTYVDNDTLNVPQTPTEAHSRGYDVGVMSAIEDIFGQEMFEQ